MKKNKTLVILSPGFPANENDTACLPAQQEFVLSLKRLYPNTAIVVLSFQYPFVESMYKWKGISVVSFNGRNRGKLYRLLLWRKVLKQLGSIKEQQDILGIIGFWYGECSFIGKKFADRHGIKFFCWILGQDARAGNKYVARTRLKAGELVAMSDFLADEFYKNYLVRPAYVITNGVNPNRSSISNERHIDILGAGSLIPLKRWDVFIDCIKELIKIYPGVKAVICGEGPEETHLRVQIKKYELEDSVSLAGELPHDQLMELMQQARVLFHPSSYEGFSTVCLEALASGAQVVSFCKPMKAGIDGWHIVDTIQKLPQKLAHLLEQTTWQYQPVIPYEMEDSVKQMMDLFSQHLVNVKELV